MTSICLKEAFPTDQQLIETYSDIEKKAVAVLLKGNMHGNTLLKATLLDRWVTDKRYSVCAQGLILGSPAHSFLSRAIDIVSSVQPGFISQPKEFLHFTLSEIAYHEEGRRSAGVNARLISDYHEALTNHLPDHPDPIGLTLHRIFPTLDPSNSDKYTASLVGAFITSGDDSIFQVRHEIQQAVSETAKLPFSARLGTIKVLFVTLGRFVKPPIQNDSGVPLLASLGDLNKEILPDTLAEIRGIQLISTATSYPFSNGHVFIDPQIDLRRSQRSCQRIRLSRSSQKAARINAT